VTKAVTVTAAVTQDGRGPQRTWHDDERTGGDSIQDLAGRVSAMLIRLIRSV